MKFSIYSFSFIVSAALLILQKLHQDIGYDVPMFLIFIVSEIFVSSFSIAAEYITQQFDYAVLRSPFR